MCNVIAAGMSKRATQTRFLGFQKNLKYAILARRTPTRGTEDLPGSFKE